MDQWIRDSGARDLALAFFAGAMLILASLANFLSHNDYGYAHLDVALVALGVLAVCAVMAVFYRAQRPWGRAVLEGLLATLFVDLNSASFLLAATVGVGVAAFAWWSAKPLIGPMLVLGSVVMITTMLGVNRSGPWIAREERAAPLDARAATAPATATAPAIVHLILDEHIGIEGLPANDGPAQRLRADLLSFYSAHGFALYGGAYSEHLRTVNSIPYILNYGRRLGLAANPAGVTVGPNEHLSALSRNGYRLTIVQSDFADFCSGSPFADCVTYDSSSLRPTLAAPLTVAQRAGLLTSKFLTLSDLANHFGSAWNLAAYPARIRGWSVPGVDYRNAARSTSVAALAVADDLVEQLRSARPGDAYFAHLLVPHYPYVVRADCTFLPWNSWERRNSAAPIEVRQGAYFDQVRCTMKKVAAALTALDRSPAGRNAVVIIHGDHGSRITRIDAHQPNLGKFQDSDLIAGFSTLFAIRAPGMMPVYYPDAQSAADLLRDFATAEFTTAPRPMAGRVRGVYLDDLDAKPALRVPLPAAWPNGIARPAATQAEQSRVSD